MTVRIFVKYFFAAFLFQLPLIAVSIGLLELTGLQVFWWIIVYGYAYPGSKIITTLQLTTSDRDLVTLLTALGIMSIYAL